MTDYQHDPITLELPGYLIDLLADWARADTVAQHPGTTRQDKAAAREKRQDLADTFVRGLLLNLPAFSAVGDFSDALNERAEAYADYKAASYVLARSSSALSDMHATDDK
jgi:hypothetical protein